MTTEHDWMYGGKNHYIKKRYSIQNTRNKQNQNLLTKTDKMLINLEKVIKNIHQNLYNTTNLQGTY